MVSPKSPDSVTERQKGGETGGASDAAAAVCVASAQLKAAAAAWSLRPTPPKEDPFFRSGTLWQKSNAKSSKGAKSKGKGYVALSSSKTWLTLHIKVLR